ncbi:Mss4-like protein [Apiospora phragmitis]|uniref:Mss4-like protein n=1 Tax=Apiospora phragmitis TaxID=2905665 RepID=A0ABR1TY46_9PEZI
MCNTYRTASCICGAIKIDVAGAPLSTYLCHCSSCQKASGVIFTSNVVYKAEYPYLSDLTNHLGKQQVQITFPKVDDPSAVLKTFEDTQSSDSGTVILRSFCAICGTA